jgi:hypothetical protein
LDGERFAKSKAEASRFAGHYGRNLHFDGNSTTNGAWRWNAKAQRPKRAARETRNQSPESENLYQFTRHLLAALCRVPLQTINPTQKDGG